MADVSTQIGGGGRLPVSPIITSTLDVGRREPASAFAVLGFLDPSPQTVGALRIINNLFTDDGKLLVDIEFDNPIWSDRDRLTRALHAQSRLTEFMTKAQGAVDLEKMSELDLPRIEAKLEAYKAKGGIRRFFDDSFEQTQKILSKVMSVPADVDEVLKCVATLKDVQALVDEVTSNRRIWSKVLGQTPTVDEKRDPRFWQRSSQFILALADFVALCADNPDMAKLRKLFFSPKPVYKAFEQFPEQ